MKIFTYILLIYFSVFYVLGTDTIRSIYDCMNDTVECTYKDVKKETEEKEDEESKDKKILVATLPRISKYLSKGSPVFVISSQDVDCRYIANIFIPPPNMV